MENSSVSKSGVGWHIDHTLRVIIGVCKSLKKSRPEEYRWRFNMKRLYIFSIGFIPRGVARAPKTVVAQQEVTREGLEKLFQLSKEELSTIDTLDRKAHFNHPFFGLLPLIKTKKFLRIHTRHHLKIVNDIINS